MKELHNFAEMMTAQWWVRPCLDLNCFNVCITGPLFKNQSHVRALEMNWSERITGPSPFLIFTINLAGLMGLLRVGGHRWLLGSQQNKKKFKCYTAIFTFILFYRNFIMFDYRQVLPDFTRRLWIIIQSCTYSIN